MDSSTRRLARRGAIASLVLGLGLVAAVPASAADIYRCIDAGGVVHFSNAPNRDCFTKYLSVRAEPAPKLPEVPGQPVTAAVAKYERLIHEAATRHRVEPALIKAVIRAESNFDPAAISPRGARGLMQLMPETATMYGLANPFDPQGNIEAGVKHLKTLLERYAGNLELALAAYNAGEQAVERYGRRIPPFPETRGYVRAVLRHREAYGGTLRTASR